MLTIDCPGCNGVLSHDIIPGRSRVETSVAICQACASRYRLDVAISRLSGPILEVNTNPQTRYPSRDPNAFGAALIDEITRITYPKKQR